jgi:putative exporter of polyketide antibiotics
MIIAALFIGFGLGAGFMCVLAFVLDDRRDWGAKLTPPRSTSATLAQRLKRRVSTWQGTTN